MLAVLRRLWFAIRRRRFERELAEELAFHHEMKQRELEADGLGAVEARHAADRALGSLALAQDRSRDVWQPRWLQGLGQDVRLAIRSLAAAPIVSMAAVLSLALGIGANTAIFSLVNSLLIRTLPVAAPERLVTLTTPRIIAIGGSTIGWPYPVWQQLWQRREMFDGIIAWSSARLNIAAKGETEFVQGLLVNGSYFETLGVPAIAGRTLTVNDDRRGGGNDGPVAVISYAFWQRHFGGAADAMGKTLTLEQVPFTIVGVTSPEFFGTEVGRSFDVALPLGTEPLVHGRDSWLDGTQSQLFVMARLKPGDSASQVTTMLRGVQPAIQKATLPPGNDPTHYLWEPLTLVPSNGDSYISRRYGRALMTLMVVVGLVLLVACANIANLLLARVAARGHELSVRLALGASRWRLVRQLFTESAVLSAIGTLSALLVANWGSRMLVQQISTRNNIVFLDLSIDWRVLAFTSGVAVATTVLFGAGPALRASRRAPLDAMHSRVRGSSSDPRTALASSLIVLQVSLSVVLVVAAGLFVRTFISLSTRPVGFERERVLMVTVNSQRAAVAPAALMAMFERVREAIDQLPGVTDVALSTQMPVSGSSMLDLINVSGGASVPPTIIGLGNTYANVISPTWFNTMGMPLVAGRGFTAADRQGSRRVAVVNQAVSRAFLNGENPVGHILSGRDPGEPREIVGMVADSIYTSVREPVPPTVYFPLAQHPIPPFQQGALNLSVRAANGSPARLTREIIAAAARVDPDLALTFRALADQVGASVTQERVVAMLSGFFGALALLLAGVGLYGVTAYAVNRRRREIGIRIALGAARQRVLGMVLSRVTTLVALGIVIGTALSLWASRFVATLLYDIGPRDPATLGSAAVALAFVGLAAGWLPARRATHVDPAVVLRDE
jgi:predicted permease